MKNAIEQQFEELVKQYKRTIQVAVSLLLVAALVYWLRQRQGRS